MKHISFDNYTRGDKFIFNSQKFTFFEKIDNHKLPHGQIELVITKNAKRQTVYFVYIKEGQNLSFEDIEKLLVAKQIKENYKIVINNKEIWLNPKNATRKTNQKTQQTFFTKAPNEIGTFYTYKQNEIQFIKCSSETNTSSNQRKVASKVKPPSNRPLKFQKTETGTASVELHYLHSK